MNDGRGGINISSGQRTKQYRLGFYNPIPECLPESDNPTLFVLIKVKRRSQSDSEQESVWEEKMMFFNDWENVVIDAEKEMKD